MNCMAVWWVFGGGVVKDCGSDDCRSGNNDDTVETRECDGKGCPRARLHIEWLMGDPKDLASERPSEHAFDGHGSHLD